MTYDHAHDPRAVDARPDLVHRTRAVESLLGRPPGTRPRTRQDLAHAVDAFLAEAERTEHTPDGQSPGGDDFPDALRRIAADVARHRASTYTPPPWWSSYRRASVALDRLARTALGHRKAFELLSRFGELRGPGEGHLEVWEIDEEIEGARVFGCLLYVAGHPASAAFWWRIAAMAGDPISARALYLQHLQRGEMREAKWWFHEAYGTSTGDPAAVPPSLPEMPDYFKALPTVAEQPTPAQPDPQPADGLGAELDRLVVHTDPGDAGFIDGIATRPDPQTANRLEELVGHR
ncbi:hypothetical protein GCM10010441_17980 [Kitasatospora paracochleata]|uniref:Tetratricopeptide repeat protein n=1 Tax=Kitasatospora paracochleata TaxID=58354 RepID=A0ABT1J9M9_9ACTN|nr:hypothetical protein [Kitasatospora paracochleata]MCP2314170.1 hypothetical protein [Kitasatospora paracochleata]